MTFFDNSHEQVNGDGDPHLYTHNDLWCAIEGFDRLNQTGSVLSLVWTGLVNSIKAFYGTSENAVRVQVWIAITVYLLVAIF